MDGPFGSVVERSTLPDREYPLPSLYLSHHLLGPRKKRLCPHPLTLSWGCVSDSSPAPLRCRAFNTSF